MDLAIGTTPPSTGPAALRAVPDTDTGTWTDTDTDTWRGVDALSAALEDSDDVSEDVSAGVALLRDAATLVTARMRLDGLLLQLAANPFDPAAYRGLRSYLVGPGVLALAAYERVSASTVRGG
jgi:hypothetical protein